MSDAAAGDVFRAVFEAYPDGVLLVDAQGRVVLANGAVAKLLGYTREALVGLPVDALVPDSVAPRHAALRLATCSHPRAARWVPSSNSTPNVPTAAK